MIYRHFFVLNNAGPTTLQIREGNFPVNNQADAIAIIFSFTIKPPSALLQLSQWIHQFGVVLLTVVCKWTITMIQGCRPAMGSISLTTTDVPKRPGMSTIGFSRSSSDDYELLSRRKLLE